MAIMFVITITGLFFSCNRKMETNMGVCLTNDDKNNPSAIEGWTAFKPSEDTHIIYVSSSLGNDATGQYITSSQVSDPFHPDVEIKPYKTITAAVSALRAGYSDWILFKRGDEWTGETFDGFTAFSGRSESDPILISWYGDSGPRPLIKTGMQSAFNHNGSVQSNVAFVGLDFYAHTRDPGSPDYQTTEGNAGLRFLGGGDNILIEDCIIRFYKTGIIVQSYDGGQYRNFKLKRSMVIDSYSVPDSGHSQGIYVEKVDGLLIEECVFDHNGWNEDIPESEATMFNHNMNIQFDNTGNNVVVKGNIVARGSSHGTLGQCGGQYEGNLYVGNSIGLQLGMKDFPLASGSFAHAIKNVILAGKLMDPVDNSAPRTPAVWGVNIDEIGEGDFKVERNIVAHRRDSGINLGIAQLPGVEYNENIVYKWESTEDMFDPEWVAPERSVSSYHATLGEAATLESFLDEVRTRGLGEWKPEYSASAVNLYIREGFGR